MMEAKDKRREPLPPSRPGRNSICQEGDHTRAETERRVEWDGRTDRCRRRQRRQHFPRFKTILLTSSLEEEEIKQTRRSRLGYAARSGSNFSQYLMESVAPPPILKLSRRQDPRSGLALRMVHGRSHVDGRRLRSCQCQDSSSRKMVLSGPKHLARPVHSTPRHSSPPKRVPDAVTPITTHKGRTGGREGGRH